MLKPLPTNKTNAALVVSANKHLFCVGGSQPNDETRHEFKYAFANNIWTRLPAMLVQRENPSICVLGSFLYSFGGLSIGTDALNIERLKVKWSSYEETPNIRWEPVYTEG